MRRTSPIEPALPAEPSDPLSHAIKGQHAQGANPQNLLEPVEPNPLATFTFSPLDTAPAPAL